MEPEELRATAAPLDAVPGVKDSTLLMLDAALILLRLAKSEARQALVALPQLLGLHLCRLPVLLLTWLSFGVLAACAVHAVTGMLVLASATFFLLQLALAVLLEWRLRRLQAQLDFPETRQGFASLQASVKERWGLEAD